jgi:hypothetical protein
MGVQGEAEVAYELKWVPYRLPLRVAYLIGAYIAVFFVHDMIDTGYEGGRWEISEVRRDGRTTVFRSKDRYAAETRLAALRRGE